VGDVLTEVYGYRVARRVIWLGFLANLILVIFIYLGQLLPAAGFWDGQEAYERILGFTGRILIASFAGYLVGEFSNSLILAKLKVRTAGRWLFLRTIGSTIVGQGIDSVIFIVIAFVGVLAGDEIVRLILTQWIVKVAYETLATPGTYLVVNFLKRSEGIDVYDDTTDFNPLGMG
ncbi:MAG: queuosine precursor transporter, partial [Chloroflexi bacterium]|nr:queuosine precursor transporter [Chloroflexota bacterium]